MVSLENRAPNSPGWAGFHNGWQYIAEQLEFIDKSFIFPIHQGV